MNDHPCRNKQASYMAEIIEAWRAGKPLEVRSKMPNYEWIACEYIPDFVNCAYRIKPTPIEAWAVVCEGQKDAVYSSEDDATLVAKDLTLTTGKRRRVVRLTEAGKS